MARTITVKGIGKVSAKPDYVVLSMTLESKQISVRQLCPAHSHGATCRTETGDEGAADSVQPL